MWVEESKVRVQAVISDITRSQPIASGVPERAYARAEKITHRSLEDVMPPMKYGVGQAVRRKEDQAFITGLGRYVDDEDREGILRGYVLRSPHASARFTIDNVDGAASMPGVHLVLTAKDIGKLGDLPCQALMKNADGKRQKQQRYPVLAIDTVRHV